MNASPGTNIYPFFLGRNALYALAHDLFRRNIRNILVPAYCCGDELEVFCRHGFKIIFYDVMYIKDNRRFESQEIKLALSPNVTAILITNYFGLNTHIKIDNLPKFRIFDNAYQFENDIKTDKNSYYIFSLRKQLRRPHGAYLVCKDDINFDGVEACKELIMESQTTYHLLQDGITVQGSGNFGNVSVIDYFGPRFEAYGGYQILYSNINHPDEKELAVRSQELRRKFKRILKQINNRRSDIIDYSLANVIIDDNVAFPAFLPLFVGSSDLFYKYLIDNSFYNAVPFWNRFSPMIDYQYFPESKKLKKQILCLSLMCKWSNKDINRFIELLEGYLC